MALAKHVKEIVLLPEGREQEIKYAGNWHLLSTTYMGAEGAVRSIFADAGDLCAVVEGTFRDETEDLARRASLHLLRKSAPVDEEQLRNLSAANANPIWYVAGPMEDLKQVRDLLVSLGVVQAEIRLEFFRYPGSLATAAAAVDQPVPRLGGS
jgi:hypothetical protein